MRHLLSIIFALLMLTVVASCIDRPDVVLDEDQMIDVLVDVHRAEGLLEIQQQNLATRPNETEQYQREVIAAVLQKHGVTRMQYDSSLMWYAQHLKLLTRVYSHVDERLNAEHEMWGVQMAESRTFTVSEAGDSVDLWTLRNYLTLDAKRYADARFWEIPSDSNFLVGDTLHWQFVIRQLLPGQKVVASMSLVPAEEKDERGELRPNQPFTPVGHAGEVVCQPGSYHLTLFADTLVSFKAINLGLVLMQDTAAASPVFADSISLIRTHVHEAE